MEKLDQEDGKLHCKTFSSSWYLNQFAYFVKQVISNYLQLNEIISKPVKSQTLVVIFIPQARGYLRVRRNWKNSMQQLLFRAAD